jgi:hypothetical protein
MPRLGPSSPCNELRSLTATAPPPSLDPALERALKAIGACLEAVEAHVPRPAPPPPSGGWLAEIPKWAPVITPIVVAVLGALLAYYLTGYFQQTLDLRKLELEVQKFALEQRKTDLSGIGQMRDLIAQLYEEGITPQQAQAIALSLAAFGDLAAPPLIHAIETGSPNRRTGAEAGLAAAALAAPDGVCGALAQVLDNRTALFSWQTHESAIRLLGQLGCQNQRLSVEAFGRLLGGGVAAYRPTVHEDGVPEVDDVIVQRLLDEQQRTLQRMSAAAQLARQGTE